MAELTFLAGESNNLALGGSGLGFFGPAGFASSVPVGDWQSNTYITNGNGTLQGPQADNIKFAFSTSGYVSTNTSPTLLTHIPNQQATLNIRFTHSSSVQVQNAKLYIYDRTNTASGAVGVSTKTAEIIHPNASIGAGGSGDSTWTDHPAFPSGSVSLTLANSPGISGFYAGNGSTSVRPDTQHDFYVAITASPDSIGSKTSFGALCSLEYL